MSNHWRRPRPQPRGGLETAVLAASIAAIVFLALRAFLLAVAP